MHGRGVSGPKLRLRNKRFTRGGFFFLVLFVWGVRHSYIRFNITSKKTAVWHQ